MSQQPKTTLPDGYHEVYHLTVTEPDKLVWLNIFSLVLLVPFVLLMLWWSSAVQGLRGVFPTQIDSIPPIVFWLAVVLVLPLHELIHGIAIQVMGHQPRYGMKYSQIGFLKIPYVLYATTDSAYFTRQEFIIIALAPMVFITLVGMGMIYVLPDVLAVYISVAVVINGSGSIGDVWMSFIVTRYPPDSLVKDEADSIRIYAT